MIITIFKEASGHSEHNNKSHVDALATPWNTTNLHATILPSSYNLEADNNMLLINDISRKLLLFKISY